MKKIKTSWYVSTDVLAAMEAVLQEERILKTHQIEMGVKMYLERHKEMLVARDLGVWD